jgi:hypothetical protein
MHRLERKLRTPPSSRRRLALERTVQPDEVESFSLRQEHSANMFRQQRCRRDAQRACVGRESRLGDCSPGRSQLNPNTVAAQRVRTFGGSMRVAQWTAIARMTKVLEHHGTKRRHARFPL